MEIQFSNPGFQYMIDMIMAFQTEELSAFWSEPLYQVYPQLDKSYACSLPLPEKKVYIEQTLHAIYQEQKDIIDEKVVCYTKHWAKCKPQICAALSEAFDVDCFNLFPDIKCNLSMNPIEPRFLQQRSFDIFYHNSERGAIGVAIHEIIHFVWFYVWNHLWKDHYSEYEAPSLKWILSEMVVESIMKDQRLCSINPYYPREEGGCIYPYFFTMKADGKLVLDIIEEMYQTQSIQDFMKNSYAYCLSHEKEIREHIAKEG
jgi:hypothetical protein